jgi:hypothetical protein
LVSINEFNIITLGNCSNVDEIFSAGEDNSKGKLPFSENQRKTFNRILALIPDDKKPYLQAGLEQNREV